MKNNYISKQIQILLNQFNAKNFELVISKGKVLIKKYSEYAILYNLVGSAQQNIGNYLEASKYFKSGLQLDKNNIALMNNLAMNYKNLLDYQSAEDLYSKIIKINDKYINAYINLGNLKRDLNQFEEAIKFYEKALSIQNKNPIIFYSLALANQGIGNFEKSVFYSQEALNLDPNFTRADHLISQSTKYNKNNEHYINLKNKFDNLNSKSFEKVDLYFSLAKAEEDIGNIEKASNYLINGNKLRKELANYKLSSDINTLKSIKEKFSKLDIQATIGYEKNNIIFILGMPRSGTSLVEQIITSHTDVFGGGELPILSNIVKNNFIDDNQTLVENFNQLIEDPLILNKLKSEYLTFIKNFNFTENYITDKAPLNFRWIGFIKLIFPKAKIIHCIRDPKNNCLSMFKNLFEGGLNFTYDQTDLVEYYNYYLDLMNFWKSKYNNSIFEVRYENLIRNNEDEIKKIIKFCDLNWQENCLAFHKNKTPIKTMSTAQARKPIYKSSIDAFEKFKNYLTVLEKKL